MPENKFESLEWSAPEEEQEEELGAEQPEVPVEFGEYADELIKKCQPLISLDKEDLEKFNLEEEQGRQVEEKLHKILNDLVFELSQKRILHPSNQDNSDDLKVVKKMFAQEIVESIKKDNSTTNLACISVLKKLDDPDITPDLIGFVKNSYKERFNEEVTTALVNLSEKDPRVEAEMRRIYDSDKSKITAQANALGVLIGITTGTERGQLIDQALKNDSMEIARSAIKNMPPEMLDEERVDQLIGFLKKGGVDRMDCKYIYEKLSMVEGEKVTRALAEEVFRVNDYINQKEILNILAERGDPVCVEYVKKILESDDIGQDVKNATIKTLGSVGGNEAIQALTEHVRTNSGQISEKETEEDPDAQAEAEIYRLKERNNKAIQALSQLWEGGADDIKDFFAEYIDSNTAITRDNLETAKDAVLDHKDDLGQDEFRSLVKKIYLHKNSDSLIKSDIARDVDDFELLYDLAKIQDGHVDYELESRFFDNINRPEVQKILVRELDTYFNTNDCVLGSHVLREVKRQGSGFFCDYFYNALKNSTDASGDLSYKEEFSIEYLLENDQQALQRLLVEKFREDPDFIAKFSFNAGFDFFSRLMSSKDKEEQSVALRGISRLTGGALKYDFPESTRDNLKEIITGSEDDSHRIKAINVLSQNRDADTADFLVAELSKNSNSQEVLGHICKMLSNGRVTDPEWFLENEYRRRIFYDETVAEIYLNYEDEVADSLVFLLSKNPNHASFFLNDSIFGNQHQDIIKSLAVYAESNSVDDLEKKIIETRDAWVNNDLPDAWKSAFFAGIFLEVPEYLPEYREDGAKSDWEEFCNSSVEEKKFTVEMDSFDNDIRSGSVNMKNFLEALRDGERQLTDDVRNIFTGLFENINIYKNYLEENDIDIREKSDKEMAEMLLTIMENVSEANDRRNRQFYEQYLNNPSWDKLLPRETLLHGSSDRDMASSLDNGFRCGEMLGKVNLAKAQGDVTNFDFDTSVVLSDNASQEDLVKSIAYGYGNVIYGFHPKENSFREGREVENTEWSNWRNNPHYRGVRTALSADECSFIMVPQDASEESLQEYKKNISEGGRFIPLFDHQGELIEDWSPDYFDKLKSFFHDLNLKGYDRGQIEMVHDFYEQINQEPDSGIKRMVNDLVDHCLAIKRDEPREREALLFDSLLYIKNHRTELEESPAVKGYESQEHTFSSLRQFLTIRDEHSKKLKSENKERLQGILDDPDNISASRYRAQLDYLAKQGVDISEFKKLKQQIIGMEDIDNEVLDRMYNSITEQLSRIFYERMDEDGDRVSFVGTGSIGRGDAAIGSDIDYAVYIDDEDISEGERERLKNKALEASTAVNRIIEDELNVIADAGKEKKEQTPVLFYTQVRDMKIDLTKQNSREQSDRQSVEPTTVVDSRPFGNDQVTAKIKQALFQNQDVKVNFSEYMFNDLYKKIDSENVLGYKYKWDRLVDSVFTGEGVDNIKFQLQRPIQFKVQYLLSEAIEKGKLDLSDEEIGKVHKFTDKIDLLQRAGIFSEREAESTKELYDYAQDMRIRSEISGQKNYDTNQLPFKDFSRLIFLLRYFDEHIVGKGVLG